LPQYFWIKNGGHMLGRILKIFFVIIISACVAACGGDDDAQTPPAAMLAPIITEQPSSINVIAPAAASFSVSASSSAPLTYQWRRDGTNIPGANGSMYTISSTSVSDNGAIFSVTVSNASGSVQSANATLGVTTSDIGTLTTHKLTSSNLERNYLLYTPANMPAGKVPLVVVLHGGSQDAAITASNALPTYAWRVIADREKIMVAFPDAIDSKWNDCRSDKISRSTANDTRFISDLIDTVSTMRAIDAERVHVTGASNGGMMTYRIALELGTKIAGVGAVIANLPVDPLKDCPVSATSPLSVVIMNGTADPLMPYEGGVVSMSADNGAVRSAIFTRDFWVAANGCSANPATYAFPDIDPNDGTTTTREIYSGCRGNHKVAFFRTDGGGHTGPSLRYFTNGRQSHDLESAEEIWKILKDARRN
jgi:polyhydroxybutyrate depolymerase